MSITSQIKWINILHHTKGGQNEDYEDYSEYIQKWEYVRSAELVLSLSFPSRSISEN